MSHCFKKWKVYLFLSLLVSTDGLVKYAELGASANLLAFYWTVGLFLAILSGMSLRLLRYAEAAEEAGHR